MSIDYYQGMDGPTIVVESADDLGEALDILHTQVIDNMGEDSPLLRVLEEAMEKVEGFASSVESFRPGGSRETTEGESR